MKILSVCLSTKFPHQKIRWSHGILCCDDLKNNLESTKKSIMKFIEDLYVDDSTPGWSAIDEGIRNFIEKLKKIMLERGFKKLGN